MENFLKPTYFIDSDSSLVIDFTKSGIDDRDNDLEKSIKLYYLVRDGIPYNPYCLSFDKNDYRASAVIEKGEGYCVQKAILLAAAARSAGIPARLGFANVKNHLSTPRMRELMKTDIFAYHGYTEMFINNRWVKATPAFNLSLCEKFNILPLEFDGSRDSIFHPSDKTGKKHMEYLKDHGSFDDFPMDRMMNEYRLLYPHWFNTSDQHHFLKNNLN